MNCAIGGEVNPLVAISEVGGAGEGREIKGVGRPECWGIDCMCPGAGILKPFGCWTGWPFVIGARWGGFFGFFRTIGSAAFGRRITCGGPPLGVRPGVRSAGEALILTAAE